MSRRVRLLCRQIEQVLLWITFNWVKWLNFKIIFHVYVWSDIMRNLVLEVYIAWLESRCNSVSWRRLFEIELRRSVLGLIISSFLETTNLIQLEVYVILVRSEFARILVVLETWVGRLLLSFEFYSIFFAIWSLLLPEEGKHCIVKFINLIYYLLLFLFLIWILVFVRFFLVGDHKINSIRYCLTSKWQFSECNRISCWAGWLFFRIFPSRRPSHDTLCIWSISHDSRREFSHRYARIKHWTLIVLSVKGSPSIIYLLIVVDLLR